MHLSKSFYISNFLHTLNVEFRDENMRDRKREKGEEFKLRSYPSRLDYCPIMLTAYDTNDR